MAENQLYDVYHGGDQPGQPASQTMSNEPERAEQTDPPPSYSPPTGPNYPPSQQGYTPGYQPPPPHQGYAPPNQQFIPPPQTTSTTTTVVVPGPVQVAMCRPNNYLVFSILSAIFCCPLFGIIGIIYASQVDSAYDRGDYWKASSNSATARGWSIASLAVGLTVGLPVCLYLIIGVGVLAANDVE